VATQSRPGSAPRSNGSWRPVDSPLGAAGSAEFRYAADMAVRRATVDDVPAIARVQVASWAGVYRGLMPDSIFDNVTLERRTEQWSRYFVNRPSASALLVAEDGGGVVVGMASVGPNRDDDLMAEPVAELLAIYVEPEHWDQGYGRRLMIACVAEMQLLGYDSATLWVLDANERGIAFYEAGGWLADGSAKIDESFGEPIREVRYRLDL